MGMGTGRGKCGMRERSAGVHVLNVAPGPYPTLAPCPTRSPTLAPAPALIRNPVAALALRPIEQLIRIAHEVGNSAVVLRDRCNASRYRDANASTAPVELQLFHAL